MRIIVLLVSLLVCVVAVGEENRLVLALIQVESGGDYDAIGDDGKALGCLQIRKCVVDDVNKHYPFHYRHKLYVHDDAFCVDKATEICWLYLKYWGGVYKKKTGKEPTNEVYARIWNGGPNGWKKKSTLKYWKKVKKQLEKL